MQVTAERARAGPRYGPSGVSLKVMTPPLLLSKGIL
jgi:hypothetical protein